MNPLLRSAAVLALVAAASLATACDPPRLKLQLRPAAAEVFTRKGATFAPQLVRVREEGGFLEGPANEPRWTSSDESVATVDAKGVVKAMGSGKATITAAADGLTLSYEVEARIVGAVEVTPAGPIELEMDAKQELTAVVKDDRGNPMPELTVKWESDSYAIDSMPNKNVCTIGGQALGKAFVTATMRDQKARVFVNVSD